MDQSALVVTCVFQQEFKHLTTAWATGPADLKAARAEQAVALRDNVIAAKVVNAARPDVDRSDAAALRTKVIRVDRIAAQADAEHGVHLCQLGWPHRQADVVQQVAVAKFAGARAKEALVCGHLQVAERAADNLVAARVVEIDPDIADRAVRVVRNTFTDRTSGQEYQAKKKEDGTKKIYRGASK